MTYKISKPHCEALKALKPGAEWTLYGDKYEGLIWLDKTQTKPTKAEFDAKKTEIASKI